MGVVGFEMTPIELVDEDVRGGATKCVVHENADFSLDNSPPSAGSTWSLRSSA
jgi:hypothetical protein